MLKLNVEYPIYEGHNFVGRADEKPVDIDLDDQEPPDRVWSSRQHALITFENSELVVEDLNSANGTFINGNPVQEATLENGQRVHLGSVELLVEAEPAAAAAPAKPRVRLAISRPETKATTEPAPTVEAQPVGEEVEAPPLAPVTVTAAYCKSHPKTPAHWLCNKCHKYFCDLCVNTRQVGAKVGKFCRSCGVECVPVKVQGHTGGERGFFSRLPGAWIYPFRGIGPIILICATIAFSALEFLSGGILFIFMLIVIYGFLFLFMQNIIHTTAADENEPLSFPEAGGAATPAGSTAPPGWGWKAARPRSPTSTPRPARCRRTT